MLKHHAHPAAAGDQPGTIQRHHVDAGHRYPALGRPLQQVDAAHQRAFAGAAAADDAIDFAGLDRKVDPVQCRDGGRGATCGISFRDTLQRDHCGHARMSFRPTGSRIVMRRRPLNRGHKKIPRAVGCRRDRSVSL